MINNEDPAHNVGALVSSKDPKKIRGMFGEISRSYDFLNHLLSLNVDKLWRKKASQMLVTRETKSILDVCCGTGDFAVALHKQASGLGSAPAITATDFTPEMCVLARRKFLSQEKALDRLASCAVADTLALPFPDNSFDLVTVAFGIRNVANTRAGLAEMCRVCKPGGTVAVLEFSHPNQKLFRALYFWYFFKVLPRVGAFVSGTAAYRYLSASVADFPDTAQFCQMFRDVASARVEARRFTFGIATLYIARLPLR